MQRSLPAVPAASIMNQRVDLAQLPSLPQLHVHQIPRSEVIEIDLLASLRNIEDERKALHTIAIIWIDEAAICLDNEGLLKEGAVVARGGPAFGNTHLDIVDEHYAKNSVGRDEADAKKTVGVCARVYAHSCRFREAFGRTMP